LWWYKNRKIFPLQNKSRLLKSNQKIDFFKLSDLDVPFVLCVLGEKDTGTLTLGSALRTSFGEALSHAQEEAMMLYEGLALSRKTTMRSHNLTSYERLKSLENTEINRDRWRFIRATIDLKGRQFQENNYKTEDIMNNCGIDPSDVRIVIFHQKPQEISVRVTIDKLLTLKRLRNKHPEALLDPFC
jgi:ribosomal protein S12 methylthiotransferase accessory factor YcaO